MSERTMRQLRRMQGRVHALTPGPPAYGRWRRASSAVRARSDRRLEPVRRVPTRLNDAKVQRIQPKVHRGVRSLRKFCLTEGAAPDPAGSRWLVVPDDPADSNSGKPASPHGKCSQRCLLRDERKSVPRGHLDVIHVAAFLAPSRSFDA